MSIGAGVRLQAAQSIESLVCVLPDVLGIFNTDYSVHVGSSTGPFRRPCNRRRVTPKVRDSDTLARVQSVICCGTATVGQTKGWRDLLPLPRSLAEDPWPHWVGGFAVNA